MSTKRRKHKYVKKTPKSVIILRWLAALLAVLLIAGALFLVKRLGAEDADFPETENDTSTIQSDNVGAESAQTNPQNAQFSPDERLHITDVAPYTGIFMEDGSDEIVSGVLMLIVENVGEEAIQYAEITMPTDNGDAHFTLSTLPAGESVVLLEKNRMEYTGKEEASKAVIEKVALFTEPLSLYEEMLELQILDGGINVTNISGEDIAGEVSIYYKNAAADLYYGGITYRVRIEGGIRANEIKQIMASHFDDTGSKILFVTIH